jgi:FHA domain/zinc-ribbon domain
VTRTCPSCGQEVADLARFCSNCGTALVDLSGEGAAAATGTLDDPITPTGSLTVDTGTIKAVAPGSAMLLGRGGPADGTSFLLDADLTTIGRSDDSRVMLDDVTVSRRHAVLSRSENGWLLHDSGSLNGTYVNGALIDQTILQGGDEVQIGKYRFIFLVGGGQG